MKNSKERQTSKVVTVESGVCEKIQSIEVLKEIYKNITMDEAAEIFYKGVLKNMEIEPVSNNYLSEIRNKLTENLNLFAKSAVEVSGIEGFTEMIKFFIKHESISTFFFKKWGEIITINPNSLQYKIEKNSKSFLKDLTVDTLHFKINRDIVEFKALLSLSEGDGVSEKEIEFYLESFANFIVTLIKKNNFEVYDSQSRKNVFSMIENLVENKLSRLFYHCFLNTGLMPQYFYFDPQNCVASERNSDFNDYFIIKIICEGIITGFDFWNAEESDLKEKILKSVKKSLEETIKYLLNNDFMLKDVLFQKVPISFLTDLEIIEGLRNFDQFPPLLFSKTQDRIKRKDQLIRFTLLLKDVMIENLGNIT